MNQPNQPQRPQGGNQPYTPYQPGGPSQPPAQGQPGQGQPGQAPPGQQRPGAPPGQQRPNQMPPNMSPAQAASFMAREAEVPTVEEINPPEPLDDIHIDELLRTVVERSCSDLHVCTDSPPVIREDGILKRLNYEKFDSQIIQRMMYEIISDDQIQKFETTFELDFSYALPKVARFRVNMYRDRGSIAAAFRLISDRIPTVEELNLPLILNTLTEKPRGLILVTGPTGSGKSTSLAAMINKINENKPHHIITIEDPIEYLHKHKISIINQRELGQDTKSFANALRAALREDPDVLLVGEMRDPETIALAITAAETGHLVFATLHTNSAAESIDRIIDVFEPGQQEQIRVQLSNNLQAIIAQQLLPRAGKPGRVPVNEVMLATPAIRNLIRENKSHQINSMIQTSGQSHGMFTMDQSLRDMYLKGIITLEDAMARCINQDELRKMISTPQQGTTGGQQGSQQRGR